MTTFSDKKEKIVIAKKRGLDVFKRGTIDVLTEDALIEKLASKEKLIVKFGIDPTTPDMHLGHTVSLTKVRQLQDLGHDCVLIIGDFTATIGDPSGRKTTRPKLTYEQVRENMTGYIQQISKIVDINNLKILYNSNWLSKLNPFEFLDILSKYTVSQLLERRDFSIRMRDNLPISVTELVYPLLVGYDSVKIKADVELGGTDQLFNFVTSREIQKAYGQMPEVILTLPLLEGTDGKLKMSKSYGNAINVDEEPISMYMKIMSIGDDLMLRYFELLSLIKNEDLEIIQQNIKIQNSNPMNYKMQLASEITSRYHGTEEAAKAENYFNSVVRGKTTGALDEISEFVLHMKDSKMSIIDLVSSVMQSSRSEARKLIIQGAVELNQKKIVDLQVELASEQLSWALLKVGKKVYYKLHID